MKPIEQLALIAEFFNLLERMLPHFTRRLAGKPARPISVSEDIWNPDTNDEGEYGIADVILMPRTGQHGTKLRDVVWTGSGKVLPLAP